ncbi:MucR family transcriptional regulator [Methylobacterium trifolii]
MDECSSTAQMDTIELAAEIVSAYVSNNPVPATELSALIAGVHVALTGLTNKGATVDAGPEKATPAQIKKSMTPEHLVSFEDGKSYKTLRRHLTLRGLTPESYREKWGLPRDYPMTSSKYSAQRSELARTLGLGQQRRKAAAKSSVAAETVSETPKKVGRPRKAPAAAAPKAGGRKKAPTAAAAE